MSIDHRLAVYGTLAPGRSNHRELMGLAGRWSNGHVRGHLVAKGWGMTLGYPTLILDPDGSIVDVQLFESATLPDHWRRLDAFEGPGYRRTSVAVATGSDRIKAWIYVAAHPLP